MGATPITNVDDVLYALNIPDVRSTKNYDLLAENQAELDIIKTLQDGVSDAEEILSLTKMRVAEFNVHLTMLEIRGIITPLGGNHWTLK